MGYEPRYLLAMEASPANGKFYPKVGLLSVTAGTRLSCLLTNPASDYIKNLESAVKVGRDAQTQLTNTGVELERTKREIDSLRSENRRLFQEMEHYRESGRQQAPAAHPPPPQYAAPSIPGMPDPSRSLPPLVNGAPAATSMQGVQYSEARH